jgi:predicted lipoprotein with Yx(FWY)xxD motif
MRTLLAPWAGTAAALLLLTGCGGGAGTGAEPASAPPAPVTYTPAPSPSPSPDDGADRATPVADAPVRVDETGIGQILVDGEGRTLYLFEKDKSRKSSCYGECAKAWPPYLSTGEPQAEEGAKADLLSTTKRDDGTEQVVYGKWPLYYYHGDKEPGDTTGHDIEEFGAEWYAVNADGKKAGE